jgi:hypothetical protein
MVVFFTFDFCDFVGCGEHIKYYICAVV